MSNLYQFNPGRKSWKIYANKITSISGDDLILSPYDGENLILEVSGNNEIIFKKGDTSYNLEDLINLSLTNYSDASFNNVEVSSNFIVRSNVGINTEIPSEKLDVNGNIKVNTSILGTNDKLELYTNTNSSDSYGFIELRSSKCTFGGPNLEFYVNSTNTSYGNRIINAESNGVAINKDANAPTHTLEVNGDIKGDNLFLGDEGTTPKIDMYFNESQTTPNNDIWKTRIEIGKSDDFLTTPAYPPSNAFGMNVQANSDGLFVGIETYDNGNNYRPLLKWGDDSTDTPFAINSHVGNHKWEFGTDGRLVVPNVVKGAPGTICKIHILPFTDAETTDVNSNNFTDVVNKTFTKTAGTNLFGEVSVNYTINGYGNDSFQARLNFYNNPPITGGDYDIKNDGNGGGGGRSGDINGTAVYTNGTGTGNSGSQGIYLEAKRDGADDTIVFKAGFFKVTEIWA